MGNSSFYPVKKTLMGPGPSNVHPRVLEAMARPTLGHLDPDFVGLMDDIKRLLRTAFQTENDLTFPISAPGSAGMEACFVNLVEPGDKVIVCQNGVFGGRMKENVERCGAQSIMVEDDWGKPIDLNKLEDSLRAHSDASVVAFVHAETSTGVSSDAAEISALARGFDCLTIMDSVTSLGGSPLHLDRWQIDAVYSGSQKCLSCPPGLSPVSFSERAATRIRARKAKVQSWFLDLSLVMNYWNEGGARSYHHTAPVNAMYALHESLVLLIEEGLEASWARHRNMHERLKSGLEEMGFHFLVEEPYRLPQLNSILIPGQLVASEASIRQRLLNEHNLEIGAGLGNLAGKIWRIGLMGYGASQENVSTCLNAIKQVTRDLK